MASGWDFSGSRIPNRRIFRSRLSSKSGIQIYNLPRPIRKKCHKKIKIRFLHFIILRQEKVHHFHRKANLRNSPRWRFLPNTLAASHGFLMLHHLFNKIKKNKIGNMRSVAFSDLKHLWLGTGPEKLIFDRSAQPIFLEKILVFADRYKIPVFNCYLCDQAVTTSNFIPILGILKDILNFRYVYQRCET